MKDERRKPEKDKFRCAAEMKWRLVINNNSKVANPLKSSGVKWLHLKVFNAIQVSPTFLISDIRALWRSALSARVPECQKLQM